MRAATPKRGYSKAFRPRRARAVVTCSTRFRCRSGSRCRRSEAGGRECPGADSHALDRLVGALTILLASSFG